jgi:hypothetical protein
LLKVKWYDQNKLARACVDLLPKEGKKLKAPEKDPKKQVNHLAEGSQGVLITGGIGCSPIDALPLRFFTMPVCLRFHYKATITFKKLYTLYPRLDDLGVKKIKGA